MTTFARRFSSLLLALAVVLPALALASTAQTLANAPASVAQSSSAHDIASQESDGPAADSGTADQHCPDQAPDTPTCHAPADQSTALSRIAPRPDILTAFGALPQASGGRWTPVTSGTGDGPDLHALSILRT